MSDKSLSTVLLDRYGPLMGMEDLAQLVGSNRQRVVNGFANNLPWVRPFIKARVRLGRHIRLNTLTVAEVLQAAQGDAGADVFEARRIGRK